MPSEENQEFGNPTRYDYMTVASPSCHDTSTTRAWWEEDAERRERFFYLVGPSLHPASENFRQLTVSRSVDVCPVGSKSIGQYSDQWSSFNA